MKDVSDLYTMLNALHTKTLFTKKIEQFSSIITVGEGGGRGWYGDFDERFLEDPVFDERFLEHPWRLLRKYLSPSKGENLHSEKNQRPCKGCKSLTICLGKSSI